MGLKYALQLPVNRSTIVLRPDLELAGNPKISIQLLVADFESSKIAGMLRVRDLDLEMHATSELKLR